MAFKACRRCSGDLKLEHYEDGDCWRCVQCGNYIELSRGAVIISNLVRISNGLNLPTPTQRQGSCSYLE